jgi:hypothetical protein
MLASKDQIKAARLKMNNPYAYLDEEGGFSEIWCQVFLFALIPKC